MQINYNREFRGPSRATHLHLLSSRFQQTHMSKHAQDEIEYIKRKDRSEIKLNQWRQKNYYKSDATQQLTQCPDDIQRVDASNLSVEEFVQKYERNCQPVIIRGCTKNWNIQKFTFQSLYEEYKDAKLKAGQDDEGYKLRISLKYYFQYLIHNKDDSPLYLFESSIQEHKQCHNILNNYIVPPYFHDDLFKLAGERRRPPYRWFIIGPERSGTTVHQDPLYTSAWNTSLTGHKRWVIFGNSVPKSIVKGKQFRPKNYQDQAINYFVQILPKIKQKYSREQLSMQEFIQGPGETVFVPGGLWHTVLNLDDTIAVTQNVMTHHCFDKVWKSTRCDRPNFAQKFLENLKEQSQELYKRAIRLNEQDEFTMGQRYSKQSVSLSFSPSSRSSSSSSSSSGSSSSSSQTFRSNQPPSNQVEVRESRQSESRSRTREKKKRTRSQGKNSTTPKRSN